MAVVNSDILRWARETAGLDLETASQKINLNSARGVTGGDRLASIEAGESAPTTALLQRMSQQYRRPLLTFYMPKTPEPADLGTDFRTLPDEGDPSNILLASLLRDVKARQSLARDALENDEDVTEVAMIGSMVDISDPFELARSIVESINFDRDIYRSAKTAMEAFGYLRELIEAKGIFVLLAGDCGHWSNAIDVNVFRGFAIADELAPFIVINDQDAKAAWSFTLLHELAHLVMGQTGISGGLPQAGIEQLCNDTAARILLDQEEVIALPLTGGPEDVSKIDKLAADTNVSRSMIAYQLFRSGRISVVRWEGLRDKFRAEWLETKEKSRDRNRTQNGGPNWYVVRRHRLGPALLALARQGISDGSLTPTRAARMLGVKPMSVYPLLTENGRALG